MQTIVLNQSKSNTRVEAEVRILFYGWFRTVSHLDFLNFVLIFFFFGVCGSLITSMSETKKMPLRVRKVYGKLRVQYL